MTRETASEDGEGVNALTFWEAATGAAAIGFSVGWICGMFLGLWACVTLGM